MYCVKCGVELADSQRVCPLCGTRVFHPDIPRTPADPPYPPDERVHPEEVNRSGVCFILTALALLPAVICVLCDWRINGGILWSGYASGGILLLYVLTVLPLWFKRPNPVIFVPVDFAAIILYLLYIDLATGGHWFLTFAFPVAGSIGVLITTVVALLRYVRRGYLYIFGGALIAAGGLAMLLEFLLNLTFGVHQTFFWSFYPLAAGVLLGVAVLFGAALNVLLYWAAPAVMGLMGAQGDVLSCAVAYLRVRSFELVFTFLFYAFQAVRQAQGDTVTPVLLSVSAVALNILLTGVFV